MTDRPCRAEQLYRDLIALPEDDRQAALTRACGDDHALRSEVETLFQAAPPTADQATIRSAASIAPLHEAPGTRIGPYTLVRRIGEGGFGAVFLAEQSEPVKRRVALKIIKLGMDTRQVVARFEQERQALAVMDHPHIAKVLDAGATETGRPYFVMELVEGRPILEYCDSHELSVAERLELFAQVGAAVQHAHTKGIIHRDLKSSNVLVGTVDGRPSPRVIDFGIAKAAGTQLTEATLYTEQGQFIGTPEFMSPEQAEGSLDIDTRTDVYALGVLLYELLTGATPFDVGTLRSSALTEIQRIIREVDPPRPSTRLAQDAAAIAGVAARRRTEPRKLSATVRGELDWIVMKAMEKDRARRYETANGLAMDIRRYLAGEAVVAVPPSTAYRVRKFVRRNRVMVLAAGAVTAALLVGLAAVAWQASVARDQRDRAVQAEAETQARAAELEQVALFQARMLNQIDATAAGEALMQDIREKFAAALAATAPPLSAETQAARAGVLAADLRQVNATDTAVEMIHRTILAPAVTAIENEFADQPLVDASLRQTLADLYRALGRYDDARPLQERALAIRRRELGEADPATLVSISHQGLLIMAQGRHAEAEPFFREALDLAPAVLGEDHAETLDALTNLATVLADQGKLEEAEPYYRAVLERSRRVLGDEHPSTLAAINNMGYLLDSQGKLEEAEPYYRDVLSLCRRVKGEDDPWTINALNNLGFLLHSQGRLEEAEPCYREALAASRRVLGEEHPSTLNLIGNLATLLKYQGRLDEAEPYYREALEKNRQVLGEDHPSTLVSLHNYGGLLRARGDLAGAEACYRDALARRRRVLGDGHPSTLSSLASLGSVLHARGRDAEAVALLAAAEADARTTYTGGRATRLAQMLWTLGQARTAEGAFGDAESVLLEAHAIFVDARGMDHADTRGCAESLVALYTTWAAAAPDRGHEASAAEWTARLASPE